MVARVAESYDRRFTDPLHGQGNDSQRVLVLWVCFHDWLARARHTLGRPIYFTEFPPSESHSRAKSRVWSCAVGFFFVSPIKELRVSSRYYSSLLITTRLQRVRQGSIRAKLQYFKKGVKIRDLLKGI